MARILLGVSGGIAAYKALELLRLATGAGHTVRVIQTPTSERFVGRASFAALSGAPVLGDEFERDPLRGAFPGDPPAGHDPLSHLALAQNADVFVIAPASANTLAKLAHGLADNLLTTAALAAACPIVVAPAMNERMWESPATQDNVALLRARGLRVLDVGHGRLGSIGEHGSGRMAEPADLLRAAEQALARGPWSGLGVLVTAGGTREPIDSVRYVGNRSSGRMGLALAADALRRGATVTVIAANVALARPAGVRFVDVTTASELQSACEAELTACDVLLMCAAVADFRPTDPAADKIKKAGREHLELRMEATPDVLSTLASRRRDGQTLVGFAAEHGAGAVAAARGKLMGKGLDAVVVNDVSVPGIGFDVPDNAVTIVTAAGERAVPRAPKEAVARAILDAVTELRSLPDERG